MTSNSLNLFIRTLDITFENRFPNREGGTMFRICLSVTTRMRSCCLLLWLYLSTFEDSRIYSIMGIGHFLPYYLQGIGSK